ncbi:MAG: hypothetical protein IJY70_01830, partial [Clostridia bacterium]|nr:hypothetical protein [Clostridia bacterium]
KNAKKSRKNRVVKRDRGIKFIAIVVFLCVTVLLLSAFLSPISPLNARIFNRTWYFVKVFSTQDYEKCLLESENVKQRGGGGFVINDGTFLVTATVFDTEEKAKTVANKIEGATVYSLQIKGGVVDKNAELIASINAHNEFYKTLINTATDYDNGSCSDALALFILQQLKEKCENYFANLDKEKYNAVANYLTNVLGSIDFALNDENHTISSRLRYCACEIICKRAKLSQQI